MDLLHFVGSSGEKTVEKQRFEEDSLKELSMNLSDS